MRKIKPSLVPAIAWFIISTILFTLPGSALPQENWLDRIWFDKWVHTTLFFFMMLFWCWGISGKIKPTQKAATIFFYIMIIWILYGVAIEFIQRWFIPNRSFDPGDIVADAIGCVGGFFFSRRRYIKK